MAEISQAELKEFYNKGALAFEKQNYDYAIEIFSQILSSKYDHLDARRYLHLSLKNKFKDTRPSFIANIVNSIDRLFGIFTADALLKKQKTAEALDRLEKVIARNPNDTETLKKMADIFYKEGLTAQALQMLEEAKSAKPEDISTVKRLGGIYLKQNDYKNAKSNLEAALKINPNDSEVLKSLKDLDALGTIQKDFRQ